MRSAPRTRSPRFPPGGTPSRETRDAMSISERASSRALAAWPADIAVRVRTSKDLAGVILAAPAILTLVALLAYPVLYNLWLGFHQKHALQQDRQSVVSGKSV